MDLWRIKVEAVTISPETAREFLTHNISNRRLDRNIVNLYSRLLVGEKFFLSNDAICFDPAGTLLNGQHRLTACVETGIPFPCIVARNVPTESYVIMDNGKNRSASDVLYVQDVKSAAVVAAIIKRYMVLCRHNSALDVLSGSSQKISNAEIDAEYNRDKMFWDYISRFASNNCAHGKWKLLKASEVGGVAAYLIIEKKHPQERVASFFEQLEGRQAPSASVITLLQQRLNDSKRNPMRKLLPFVVQKLVIKAWNAFVTGKVYMNFFYNEKSDKDIWFV